MKMRGFWQHAPSSSILLPSMPKPWEAGPQLTAFLGTPQDTRKELKVRITRPRFLHALLSLLPIAALAWSGEVHFDLFEATKSGDATTLHALLSEGADPNARDPQGATALSACANGGHLESAKILLTHGADVNAVDRGNGYTPLHWASQQGHTELVQLLLDNGAHVDARQFFQATPLRLAAYEGHALVVRTLLARGADPNLRDKKGGTALWAAAYAGRSEVVEALLASGAAVDSKDTVDGNTALMVASLNKHAAVVRALLAGKADKNAKSNVQWTPLMFGAVGGDAQVVRLLLESGVEVSCKNEKGNTALSLAQAYGQYDAVSLLQAHGASAETVLVKPNTVPRSCGDAGHCVTVTVDAKLLSVLSTWEPEIVFFTSAQKPLTTLSEIHASKEVGVWGSELTTHVRKLFALLGVEDEGFRVIGDANFPELFQKNPTIRLFITWSTTPGQRQKGIVETGGGAEIQFVGAER